MMYEIPYKKLWEIIIRDFRDDLDGIHGVEHWRSVEINGLKIAEETKADKDVVRLFAIFHDAMRISDTNNEGHDAWGAELALQLRGIEYQLEDERFSLLYFACKHHATGKITNEPTIGTCWDADRLDLVRVGVAPKVKFMSTEPAKKILERKFICSVL